MPVNDAAKNKGCLVQKKYLLQKQGIGITAARDVLD